MDINIIEKKCTVLLRRALSFEASDILIVPTNEEYSVYFRKYNRRIEIGKIPLILGDKMVSHFKYQSTLDIAEKRKPQSGAFQITEKNNVVSCRISTLPSIFLRESVVIRLMLQNVSSPLEKLCFNSKDATILKNLAHYSHGLIIFSGPTGCGKSTTMYSLLQHCSESLAKHVISLEDPVENNQENLLQIQVNERAGVTYAAGLKAILRHSPDVIMIGEIRDQETAKIAIEAALTGHLVMTTVHAKNSFGCLHRLLDLGVSSTELKQSVLGVATQKLVTLKNDVEDLAAVFELLMEDDLLDAFEALDSGSDYTLSEEKTIHNQIKRGIYNHEILPNALVT
ncbi:competence type IV pilus ATPase ComGA [Kurthia sibirica]|uniref:Competence protein ComG n=1 Tax=Kurthia sibirica TaxID=202750 RepID=A0A2U3AM20_9BACL|nr:competence type IV pilus ATPase ComGA [Kurthia sibirica]PWI25537.1 competence protein ComG [Kurthia sibirica]GEK33913.1 competence protein ComG [Kurthia sibirica]